MVMAGLRPPHPLLLGHRHPLWGKHLPTHDLPLRHPSHLVAHHPHYPLVTLAHHHSKRFTTHHPPGELRRRLPPLARRLRPSNVFLLRHPPHPIHHHHDRHRARRAHPPRETTQNPRNLPQNRHRNHHRWRPHRRPLPRPRRRHVRVLLPDPLWLYHPPTPCTRPSCGFPAGGRRRQATGRADNARTTAHPLSNNHSHNNATTDTNNNPS